MNSTKELNCFACGSSDIKIFYNVENAPVHSVLLFFTAKEAVDYTKRNIKLGFCRNCGFISNLIFDETAHEYSEKYEETQGFSATFNAFHEQLARTLIDRHDLHNKDIIEIGCGKGDFLNMLCEMGGNKGIGFDPAFIDARNKNTQNLDVKFVKDFYSEKYSYHKADFVCCKMTLEHIHDVGSFISMVRRSIGENQETIVFFQIPNMTKLLDDMAFWDIYYEHCSYFTKGSLSRLFAKCGFDVISLSTEYDDQYLTIEARPGEGQIPGDLIDENDLNVLNAQIKTFEKEYSKRIEFWRNKLEEIDGKGQKVVLWGSGSKAVSFLTALNGAAQIKYGVDINPYKKGTFLAGSGQEIVMPEFLKEYKPDYVIIMNPIYVSEISQKIKQLNLNPELLTV